MQNCQSTNAIDTYLKPADKDLHIFISMFYIPRPKDLKTRHADWENRPTSRPEELELQNLLQQLVKYPKWMYDWLDDLEYFEAIDFRRHKKQRILSFLISKPYTGKGKVFVINKIIDYIQPKTVLNFQVSFESSTVTYCFYSYRFELHSWAR